MQTQEQKNTAKAGATEKLETRIGALEFTHGFANAYQTRETVEKLYNERDFQYGPQKGAVDGSWMLDDIERVH